MEEIQDVLSKRNQERRQKLIGMDIVAVAYSLGMTLKEGSSGSYYWDEHDSFHIYPKTNTFRWWSRGVGTNTIDLVQVVKEELTGQKPSFLEVASFLETGKFDHVSIQPIIKEPFKYYLERFEQPSFDVARQYLREERGLSDETIDTFLASKNMALITYKTGGQIEPVIVFKSRDETGKMIGANLQGIVENRDKYPKYGRLKQVMKNSDGLAGFSFDIGQPKRLIFTEAAIDLIIARLVLFQFSLRAHVLLRTTQRRSTRCPLGVARRSEKEYCQPLCGGYVIRWEIFSNEVS